MNGTEKISNVIKKTEFQNLDIITSNVDLSGLELETAGDSRRAFILKDELTAYLNDSSSIICANRLSTFIEFTNGNVLMASNSIIVPLQTEFFALEGLTQLMKTIDRIKNNLNPELSIRGILLTMYDKRK